MSATGSPLHARLPVREGGAHLRFAHRVHPAHGDGGEVRAVVVGVAVGRLPHGGEEALSRRGRPGEAGLSSKRAMARQPSVNTSGSANHRATSRRGICDGTGMSSATTARPATAGTARRSRRSASATVRPSPSGTASPARTSRSASVRTASAVAAAFRTGAMGDWPSGPIAPITVRSMSSRPRGSTTVAQPVCASSSRR